MLERDSHFHMHCHSVMQNVPFSTQHGHLLENVLSLNPLCWRSNSVFFSGVISSLQQVYLTHHDLMTMTFLLIFHYDWGRF